MNRSKKDIQLELLFLQLKKGNSAALTDLIAEWERPLFYFIRRIVSTEEDAWDTLQETWLKVFHHSSQLQSSGTMSAWLYKIARNTAIDLLRKQQRFEQFEEKEEFINEDCGIEIDFNKIDIIDLHSALNQLSLQHRETITLHFLESFTIQEISEIIEVSPGTVKSRLHYAKKALRELLLIPGKEGE